jgi:AraC-like DNA-binding protein
MEVQFFKPKNALLRRYMDGYYFLTKRPDEPEIRYLTFPTNLSILSVARNATLELEENRATVQQSKNNFYSLLIAHYIKPIEAVYKGAVDEVNFYFKPLGLHAFLPASLSYHPHNTALFIPYGDYKKNMLSILNEKDITVRQEMIEAYWLSKLVGFEHDFLYAVIDELTKPDDDISIQEIAKKYNTSRQTINKLFMRYLGKSPVNFKKINRFRETLSQKTIPGIPDETLTALSYACLFYDQSHMIKEFKKLTGLTPKAFFKKIPLNVNGLGNWLFKQ